MSQAEERSAARDFMMARLAACRVELATAITSVDECLLYFVDPSDDPKAKERRDLLEAIDGAIGSAAAAVQLAQTAWKDIDPKEGEPEAEEEEEEEEEEEIEEDH